MSAILSADDLNDFISPGVACIKPVETLSKPQPDSTNPYEVIKEDKAVAEQSQLAQISLTDCLACSGCVTSAEAVLISLQSHEEVLSALDSAPQVSDDQLKALVRGDVNGGLVFPPAHKIFVASISPQVRASLAATYDVSEREAGFMVEQLLSGPDGIRTGGLYGNKFSWVIDTNVMRELCLVMGTKEAMDSSESSYHENAREDGTRTIPKRPVLTSACPGWICYAEKTHPHVLPHLSRLKSPQALTGTLIKSVVSRKLGISPSSIWHLAIMPCFDKKLEASRQELTDLSWWKGDASDQLSAVRDVDCVITAREVLMLAEARGVSFPSLPREGLSTPSLMPFPDTKLDTFLFPQHNSIDFRTRKLRRQNQRPDAGSSGGYLYHLLRARQSENEGSVIEAVRGRNADVVEYNLKVGNETVFRAARYYGNRNITNLVRKLKPPSISRLAAARGARARNLAAAGKLGTDLAYVEVMACPGGCTNGGGQIKLDDLGSRQSQDTAITGQREWLAKVEDAYFCSDSSDNYDDDSGIDMATDPDPDVVNGISRKEILDILAHWSAVARVEPEKLIYTTFRKVESDIGKAKDRDTERVAELAGKIGGGW